MSRSAEFPRSSRSPAAALLAVMLLALPVLPALPAAARAQDIRAIFTAPGGRQYAVMTSSFAQDSNGRPFTSSAGAWDYPATLTIPLDGLAGLLLTSMRDSGKLAAEFDVMIPGADRRDSAIYALRYAPAYPNLFRFEFTTTPLPDSLPATVRLFITGDYRYSEGPLSVGRPSQRTRAVDSALAQRVARPAILMVPQIRPAARVLLQQSASKGFDPAPPVGAASLIFHDVVGNGHGRADLRGVAVDFERRRTTNTPFTAHRLLITKTVDGLTPLLRSAFVQRRMVSVAVELLDKPGGANRYRIELRNATVDDDAIINGEERLELGYQGLRWISAVPGDPMPTVSIGASTVVH